MREPTHSVSILMDRANWIVKYPISLYICSWVLILPLASAEGNLIGNLGTEPLKIPHEFSRYVDRTFTGEGTPMYAELPPDLRLQMESYRSYHDFKNDFLTGPVHQAMRQRRIEIAGLDWDFVEGIKPEVLSVKSGATKQFLTEVPVLEFNLQWDESDTPLAAITSLPGGGLQATGGPVNGSAVLTIRTAEGLDRYSMVVTDADPAEEVGPFERTRKWWAGDWDDQRHYFQLRHEDWCSLVGCGPTALAMLFGWWDWKGVPTAFYTGIATSDFPSLSSPDAPHVLNPGGPGEWTVRRVYSVLHDQCDVICFPATDAGATWPGDLVEGFYSYLFPITDGPIIPGPACLIFGDGKPLVDYSSYWAWDAWGSDWAESGRRVAKGIRKGRPGVIGLGVLWHYGVAYGFRQIDQGYRLPGGTEIIQRSIRHLKVNEGWADFSPSWYSAGDVFLGLTCKLVQLREPTLP